MWRIGTPRRSRCACHSGLSLRRTTFLTSWTQYAADVLLGLSVKRGKKAVSPSSPVLLYAIPCLDLLGGLLGMLGLDSLGAGPFTFFFSSILLTTALLSRVILRKRLSGWQSAGIALVSCGLAARSLLMAGSDSGSAAGILLTLASSLSYTLRTIAMELLGRSRGAPTGAEVSALIGRWGFLATTCWQLGFTLPRRGSLLDLSAASPARIVGTHLAFMAARLAFVKQQNLALAVAGANGVALVTAVRSVAVALVAASLFCSTRPSQCLSSSAAACSAVVLAGGALYALAAPAPKTTTDKKRK